MNASRKLEKSKNVTTAKVKAVTIKTAKYVWQKVNTFSLHKVKYVFRCLHPEKKIVNSIREYSYEISVCREKKKSQSNNVVVVVFSYEAVRFPLRCIVSRLPD